MDDFMNAYSFQKPHEKILTPLSLGVNVRDFRRAARNHAVTKRQRQRYSSLRLPGKHGGFLPDLPHVSALFLPACFLSILHTRARAISQKQWKHVPLAQKPHQLPSVHLPKPTH